MSQPCHRLCKWASLVFVGLLLPAMVFTAINAGISGDEYLHLNQASMVLDYFTSLGHDQSALHTPVTHLKYYGQSFDNVALLLANGLHIEDIFTFRHIMAAIAGWLTLLFTVLLTVEIAGWPAALISLLLMVATPAFTGHSLNNLKDIPFALGYVASLFFMIKWVPRRHKRPYGWWLGLILSLAFLFSIRPGGLLAFAYLWAFTLLSLYLEHQRDLPSLNLRKTLGELVIISIVAWITGCLFWPYALENPLWHPLKSFLTMSHYPVTIRQLFEGRLQWSDLLPWYYLPKMMLLTLPVALLPGLVFFVSFRPIRTEKQKNLPNLNSLFLAVTAFFPVVWIIITHANVYGHWRHLLFVLPPLVIVGALGLNKAFNRLNQFFKRSILGYCIGLAGLLFLLWHPLAFTLHNKPFQYLYFNQLAGGLKNAFGNYETDYYFHSIKPAAEWLDLYLQKSGEKNVVLASNFETKWFFRKKNTVKHHLYTGYYNKEYKDWDYGIFAAAYLYPSTISHKLWPPKGTIHTINIDGVPVCVIVKRPTKATYEALNAAKLNQPGKADSLFSVALELDPRNENTWLEAGRFCLKNGDTDQALEKFNQALTLLPNYEPALLNVATTLTKKGRWDEALTQLNNLLLINPKHLPAYIEKANIHIHQKEFEQATETIQKCLKIKPGYKPAIEKLNSIDYL